LTDSGRTITLNLICGVHDTFQLRELLGNVEKRGLPFTHVGLRRKLPGNAHILPQYLEYHDIEIDGSYFKMLNEFRIISTKPITFPENVGIRIAGFDYVLITNDNRSLQIRCTVKPKPMLIYPESKIYIPAQGIIIELFQ